MGQSSLAIVSPALLLSPPGLNLADISLSRSVFFLYFSGRLNATQTLLQPALSAYYLAIQAQREYIQLQHICHWFVLFSSLGPP